MLELNKIHLGDCLDLMGDIPDGSVDLILADLPYGLTQCAWDSVIPLDKLWEHYKRVIKKRGAVVLTASGRFVFELYNSNPGWYKYDWVWDKINPSGFLNAKIMPIRAHEYVMVFCDGKTIYNRQMRKTKLHERRRGGGVVGKENHDNVLYGTFKRASRFRGEWAAPISIITILGRSPSIKNFHQTQKPTALFSYLIKTYTNEGHIVLDNCIGSGTTAISALETGRQFIGIEKDPEYHRIAVERVEKYRKEHKQLDLF